MLRGMRASVLPVLFAVIAAVAVAACSKDQADKPAPAKAPVTAGTVGADGVRKVAVTASRKGYEPAEIAAKPNEKLILVFTRTVEGECLSQIKVGDGALVELPMNTPVEYPVTVPASGTLKFVCGMDMFSGVIAIDAAG
jgi:plastocyanin domain-containing protein